MFRNNTVPQDPVRNDGIFFLIKMKNVITSIQGIRGSFHDQAASEFFGKKYQALECKSFKETCVKLQSGDADCAAMAIENSIAGSLLPNYGLMQEHNLAIIGEVYLPIKLYLMGLPGVQFEDIKYVQSHPIAIRQCVEFFEEFPDKQLLEKNDTAACAKEIADKKLEDTFAIAGAHNAKLYGLEIKERRIEKTSKNFTRFLILQREGQDYVKAENNKATISFTVHSSVGSLAKVLNIFAENNINLTKIQSTPVLGQPHKDNFFIDLKWNDYQNYQDSLSKILRHVSQFSILGEYVSQDQILNTNLN